MVRTKKIIQILPLLLLFIVPDLFAQFGPPKSKAEFEKMYKRRSRAKYLYGVYIPRDMGEAFNELNNKIDKESKAKFIAIPEDIAARKLHFSLGRWMTVNWSFYEGSRFAKYLRDLGVTHPDDMAYFTIVMYHRHLKKSPLDVKSLVVSIKEKRLEAAKARRSGGEVIEETKRIRPRN